MFVLYTINSNNASNKFMEADNKERNPQNKETMQPSTSIFAGEVKEKEGKQLFFDHGGFIRALARKREKERERERERQRQRDRDRLTERDRERTLIRKLSFTMIVVYVQSKT